MKHELRFDPPARAVRHTPWGWKSWCVCGWRNPDPLLGTAKRERRAYYTHKQEATTS